MASVRGFLYVPSVAAIAGMLWANQAMAQESPGADPGGSGLQDIIVTATRRESRLQTTPAAVSAVDQSLIRLASPRNHGHLAGFVPNFSAATIAGFDAASFSHRGVRLNTLIYYYVKPKSVVSEKRRVVPGGEWGAMTLKKK